MATILVIYHVPHERLGTFEPALTAGGCEFRTLDTSNPKADWSVVETFDGLVVMGGLRASLSSRDTRT